MALVRGLPAAAWPLVLADDAGVGVQRTLRRLRDDQRRLAEHHLAVDCFGVAGGRELVVETLEHYLLFPELRPQLGDARSVPRGRG